MSYEIDPQYLIDTLHECVEVESPVGYYPEVHAWLRDTLADALGRLNTRDRILFYRKYYYMQSTAQIAAEVGMTERAVEGRLYRIKKRLREWLGGGRNE